MSFMPVVNRGTDRADLAALRDEREELQVVLAKAPTRWTAAACRARGRLTTVERLIATGEERVAASHVQVPWVSPVVKRTRVEGGVLEHRFATLDHPLAIAQKRARAAARNDEVPVARVVRRGPRYAPVRNDFEDD